MFYDPTCKPEIKSDPYSLEALIGWLENQIPHMSYRFMSINGSCLIGQYATEIGVDWHRCHSEFYERNELWIASNQPYTFGAALERARNCQSNGGGCEPV